MPILVVREAVTRRLGHLVRSGAVALGLLGPCVGMAQTQAADPAVPAGHSDAALRRMADGLARRLAGAPTDLDGWVLLGRTRATLRQWDAARDALNHAIALAPDAPALHAQLGEILALQADGVVTPDARAEFARAKDDPRSRFYTAVGLAQAGDTAQALTLLRALAADTPADVPWRGMIGDEIAALTDTSAPPTPPASPASAAIHDFLAGLGVNAPPPETPAASAASLESTVRAQPHDVTAWLHLAQAYQAQGHAGEARDALKRANQAVPANLDVLLAYGDALAADIQGDELPAALVGAMRQVIAIDADQPDALWYLGIDAAHRGDSHAARKFWLRLSHGLPEKSQERAAVQARLDALH